MMQCKTKSENLAHILGYYSGAVTHVQLDEDSTLLIPQEVVERLEINSTATVAWCVWWRSDKVSPSDYQERAGGGGPAKVEGGGG